MDLAEAHSDIRDVLVFFFFSSDLRACGAHSQFGLQKEPLEKKKKFTNTDTSTKPHLRAEPCVGIFVFALEPYYLIGVVIIQVSIVQFPNIFQKCPFCSPIRLLSHLQSHLR